MQEKIVTTTAAGGLGHPAGHKLLKVASGQYAGRQVAIMQTSSGDIKYSYADRPYSSWSAPVTIASDAADEPFDAVMGANGDIHVVYSEIATQYLVTHKLVFSGGVWSVASKVTIYNGDVSLYPSVGTESGGTLWVCWAKVTGGSKTLYVKSSTDAGATWGAGPADNGTALTSGASSAYPKVLIDTSKIHVIYTEGGLQISIRSLPISGGSWSSEYVIASGILFDEHFDAAVAPDGRLAAVWDNSELKYREFDGAIWGAITTLDTNGGFSPQLFFTDNIPIIVYLSSYAGNQNLIMYTSRHTGSFSTPVALDKKAKPFDGVVLYDSTSSDYEDATSAAANSTTGDVYHQSSNVLIGNAGDAVYFGMDDKFRYVKILMSTAGSGGTVVYSYWDGSSWQAFTPAGGNYPFDAIDKDLLLWEDYNNISQDWQKRLLNGDSRFWIKIETASSFSTAPVGSQLTAISDIKTLAARR